MAGSISPDLYNQYKEQVLAMSLATQYYIGLEQQRVDSCLTDVEIAQKLGLTVSEVREIRIIAENDLHPADAWTKSETEKRKKCERFYNRRSKSNYIVKD